MILVFVSLFAASTQGAGPVVPSAPQAVTDTPSRGHTATSRVIALQPSSSSPDVQTLGGAPSDDSLVLSVGSTTPRKLTSRFGEQVNVLDYGADPTGAADSSAAFEKAIAACMTAGDPARAQRRATRALFVPNGRYRLTRVIKIWSVIGFAMRGDSKYSTQLVFDGDFTGAKSGLLDLNGTAYSSFSDFSIVRANASQFSDVGVHVYWRPAALPGTGKTGAYGNSTQNDFKRIIITHGCRIGFAIGDAFFSSNGYQADGVQLDCVVVQGDGGVGWRSGEHFQTAFAVGNGYYGNVLVHALNNCQVHWYRYGIKVAANQAVVDNFEIDNGEVAFYVAGIWGYFGVRGGRAEGVQRLVWSGGTTSVGQMTLQDYKYACDGVHPDRDAISWSSGGTLRLIGLHVMGLANTRPRIYLAPDGSGAPPTLLMDGCIWEGQAVFSDLFNRGSGTIVGSAIVRGLRFPKDNSHFPFVIIGNPYEAHWGIEFASADAPPKYRVGLNANGHLQVGGANGGGQIVFGPAGGLGFYGSSPGPRPVITGSRGGNAALAQLLRQLTQIGLVVDNTAP